MKQIILNLSLLLFLIHSSLAKTIVVDKSGFGQYTSIQAGINAAVLGDTVKVLPGVYEEQVTLSKSIVVQGSGYEYTRITSNASQTLIISNGKIMWFSISSNVGSAVQITGGTVTNCVIWNSAQYGVITGSNAANAVIMNCIIANNANYGVYCNSGTLAVINTIFLNNGGTDNIVQTLQNNPGILQIMYCRGYRYWSGSTVSTISDNPQFMSVSDLKLQPSSPCIDAGKPDVNDPDGTRSDMGYYGGPDAPVFPVVTNLRLILNPNGTITVRATAQSRY